MSIIVRASGDPTAVATGVNAALREADPALPPIGGQLMEDLVSTSVGQPRFTSQLPAFFAVVALLLGALGIHGVLSYVVAALAGARVLRGLLFGVGPTDPASFGMAVAVLCAAAFLACYGPARRVARIDPTTALRAE